MRDGVHQGRVVPSAATYDKATDVSRQQGDSLSDAQCMVSSAAVLDRRPVGEVRRKIKPVKGFGEWCAKNKDLKQRCKAISSTVPVAAIGRPSSRRGRRDPVIDGASPGRTNANSRLSLSRQVMFPTPPRLTMATDPCSVKAALKHHDNRA